MKLSCPNCGAGFEVRAEALGPTGRKVRCSACSYQWTARATQVAAAVPPEAPAAVAETAPAAQIAPEPPAPVLAETTLSPLEPAPPEPPPEPEVESPDITALRETAILRPSAPTPRPPAPQEDEAESTPDGPPPTRAEIQPPRHRGAIVGWLLFALVLIALGGAVWKREQLMAAFPQTREIFRAVGFNVPGPADGLDLVAPQPTWVRNTPDGQPLLVVQGVVKNLSDGPREIPPLRAILRDGTVEVQSWTFAASAPRVEAGGEVPYRLEIRAPPAATTIAVVFSITE